MKKQLLLSIVALFLICNIYNLQSQTLNESLGSQAGVSITSGDYNVMLGDSAAYSLSSGSQNTMVGMAAGRNQTSGQQNTYVGRNAGYTNTTGQDNVALGDHAGYFSTDTDGVFIGSYAGYNNTVGSDVVFIGEEAGLNNTTGDDNTFIGEDAGYNNTTASDNTFVGSTAGRTNTTGYRNAFFGSEAGYDNRDGHHNVAVGDSAGIDNSTGRWNTFVGAGSGAGSEYATGVTFIGAYAGYDNNRTNNTSAATRAWFNTYVGVGAGSSNREGSYNTALGYGADQAASTSYYPGNGSPVAGGGSNRNYDRGTYIGTFANSGGDDIVALGYDAETFAARAISIGAYSDADNTDGIAIGYLADVTGSNSIGIGREVNTTHTDAVAIGRESSTTYTNAVAIGRTAVADTSSIALGYAANVLGQYGLAIGESVTIGENIKYSSAIGYGASATASNSMVLGGVTTTDRVSVGIGTTAPNQNASLELADTDKGFQINRLTNAQRTTLEGNLATTDEGLVVYDSEDKSLYTWDGTQWNSTIADNLGSHTATTNLDLAQNNITEVTYLNFDNVEGNGVRFWNGSDNYKISMGNSTEYQYGPVTDYSIKTNMNNTTGRGWTWGIVGETPIAALDNTGKLQIANTLSVGAYTLPNTDGTTNQVLTTDGSGTLTWATQTDNQDLSLSGNTLSLTNDATTVDLSAYLDNTDTQDLDLSGNTLSLTNDATTVDLSGYLDNTDTQAISLTTNTLSITGNASTVDLSGYLDNTDAQDLDLSGNTLSLTNDATTVDLSGYLDNTDTQAISLATNTLSITGNASTVDLSGYLDNTDAQDLQLLGNTLSLTNDATTVDLSAYVNTDNQNLTAATLTGTDLTIEIQNGTSVSVDLAPLISTLQSDLSTAQSEVATLQTQMTDVLTRLQTLEDCACDILGVDDPSGEAANTPKLYQNIPNPFNGTSSIKYYLPLKTNKAAIVFSDGNGKIISNIPLQKRGEAELDINSEGLAVGVYYYTLYVEGQKAATRRMVIE